MPVTMLDPRSAWVVIDLQKGLMSYPTVDPVHDITARAARLASVFRKRRLPVVLVNVAGRAPGRIAQSRPSGEPSADWADLIEELDAQEDDIRITKRTWGAFAHTGLESKLRELGTTQIVLCGIATSIGVESTAREAYALGFNVALATDAMTDMDQGAQENSLGRIFPKLGETGTTDEIIGLVERL